MKTLVIGYGSPLRGDDWLGPALAQALQDRVPSDVTIRIAHQLGAEDALELRDYARVVWIDASALLTEAYRFRRLEVDCAVDSQSLSHHVTPGSIAQLAARLYDARPDCYVLAVRGVRFEVGVEALSDEACVALNSARVMLLQWILNNVQQTP